MDYCALDPYEQQLFKVFSSYDREQLGSLDRDGLQQLCHTLQLEEKGADLIRAILPSHPSQGKGVPRATFGQFRDALLTLLGKLQQSNNKMQQQQHYSGGGDNSDYGGGDRNSSSGSVDTSPEREVLPKFVYGSKKYGRRSRPKIDDLCPGSGGGGADEFQHEYNYNNRSANVQRSNSQCESISKKRRASQQQKLKRCTSFPGSTEYRKSSFESGSAAVIGLGPYSEPPSPVGPIMPCSEDMLREAWRNLGVGTNGYLNQTELILVCDAIGLHKLANGVIRQLSDKLSVDYDHKISFEELLEVLQHDDTWSDVLNGSGCHSPISTTPRHHRHNSNSSTPIPSPLRLSTSSLSSSSSATTTTTTTHGDGSECDMVRHIVLGPDGSGVVSADVLVDLWEAAGVAAPKMLLADLGFIHRCIDVSELAGVLEREIKGLNDNRTDYGSPHVALLQAFLALYQSEIKCLKEILEQVNAEREKLRSDVGSANQRATMLAQEVDDNHAKMEANTQNQVQLLEQKHSDMIKEMTEHFTGEKERMSTLNQTLQEKIESLESAEAKLQNDLKSVQTYGETLECDNQRMVGEISELTNIKQNLSDQIVTLESDRVTTESSKLEHLLVKLDALRLENSQLRDRNDEMVSRIESLSGEVTVLRSQKSQIDSGSSSTTSTSSCGISRLGDDEESINVGVGAKRRNDDSPTVEDVGVYVTNDGSPRLGKIRKFLRKVGSNTGDTLDVPVASSESGFETEIDYADSSSSTSGVENEDIVHLLGRVTMLEQLLAQHSIPVPKQFNSSLRLDVYQQSETRRTVSLLDYCKRLESTLYQTKSALDSTATSTTASIRQELDRSIDCLKRDCPLLIDGESDINVNENECNMRDDLDAQRNRTTTTNEGTEVPTTMSNDGVGADCIDDETERLRAELETLRGKCADLEASLEQMRIEYENCEDYWAAKLDEERQIFDQEQTQTSKRLAEVIEKLNDFEEQYNQPGAGANPCDDAVDSRLPVIEERDCLERQYVDLEEEYQVFRAQVEDEMKRQCQQIEQLNMQMQRNHCDEVQRQDAVAQTDEAVERDFQIQEKLKHLTRNDVEATNLISAEGAASWLPPGEQWPMDDRVKFDPDINSTNATGIDSVDQPWASTTDLLSPIPVQSPHQPTANSKSPATACESVPTSNLDKKTPCRPKRMRRHGSNHLYNKRKSIAANSSHEALSSGAPSVATSVSPGPHWASQMHLPSSAPGSLEQPTCVVPVSIWHSLKILDQKNRYLHGVIKQQHRYYEGSLQYYYQQQCNDRYEYNYKLKGMQEQLEHQLRICHSHLEKLSKSDILIKELYVENTYLMEKVENLQGQCNLLKNYTADSASV